MLRKGLSCVALLLVFLVLVLPITGCAFGKLNASTSSPTPTPTPTPTSTHSVTVTWDASSSGNAVGYRVYRSQTSGGPYAGVSGTLAASPQQFTDSSVTNGQNYFYVVTTIDSNGIESPPSPEASAQIPTS